MMTVEAPTTAEKSVSEFIRPRKRLLTQNAARRVPAAPACALVIRDTSSHAIERRNGQSRVSNVSRSSACSASHAVVIAPRV